MAAIRLSVVIGEDRQLIVKLPDDTPVGPAELEIHPQETAGHDNQEDLRAYLAAAGLLAVPTAVELGVPADARPLTLEERLSIGKMPPAAPLLRDSL